MHRSHVPTEQVASVNEKIRKPYEKVVTGRYALRVDFTQLLTLIANISRGRQDIQNRKNMRLKTIPPAFSESLVNVGPLSRK